MQMPVRTDRPRVKNRAKSVLDLNRLGLYPAHLISAES